IMAGTAPDVALVKNDVLYIPSIHDLNDIGNVTVAGEVAKPGTYVYADNMTLEDAIMIAGGLLESASTVKIDVSRRIKNPTSATPSETVGELFTFSFKDGYVLDGEVDFVLQPYDHIMVRRSPGYETQKIVRVTGEVVFPGEYTLTKKEERISDLVEKSGGLTQWAYVKGARLLRRVIGEERTRMQSTLEILDSSRDSINIERLDLRANYFVGIDLEAALADPGSDADLVLREGDILGVPEYINTVKITGNVMYPNTVTYNPDMTVNDYITQAGGYGYRSKKSKAYIIYLNGNVERAKRFSRNVVEPGCEIVVPQKRTKDGQLQEILAISTTAASHGTMIATIGNILR
ncbi:MAG: SLBB domain-containing protein, partial [Mogibacterium sp.]|nr:SLBB domain-containing protein [Mogibacterium sp.]